MSNPNIELADAIQALRNELIKAQQSKDSKEILFQIEDVELEVQFQASKLAGAETGIKFWLVSLGAKGEHSSTDTHTIKLKLQALTSEGGDVKIGNQMVEPE